MGQRTEDRGHLAPGHRVALPRPPRRYYDISIDLKLPSQGDWANLHVIGMCYCESVRDGQLSGERRYFIGSRKAKAKVYGRALRNHWAIENNVSVRPTGVLD